MSWRPHAFARFSPTRRVPALVCGCCFSGQFELL
ncbi:hypothetical protein [Bacteriophage sp.]|nr:hypothetical protein [Bacteriophage sp.]UOF80101.1 hypothetical protein [Bacteriophage sp.]